MPQIVARRYKTERELQRGVVEMGAHGWRVVSQSSFTPKKGCLRWMLGGFIFFNRRPEHLVTFEGADDAVPVITTGVNATLTPEEVGALAQTWSAAFAEHMANLSTPAKWLHQKPFAISALVVYCALILAGFAWQAATDVMVVATVALALIDWPGMRSLHGRVNWALYRAQHPRLFWWAATGLVLFCMVPGVAYLLGCVNATPAPTQESPAPVADTPNP